MLSMGPGRNKYMYCLHDLTQITVIPQKAAFGPVFIGTPADPRIFKIAQDETKLGIVYN